MVARSLILILVFLFIQSCVGPKLTVCIIDPSQLALQCHNQRTDEDFTLPIQGAENYVALSSDDFAKLLDFIKDKNCH